MNRSITFSIICLCSIISKPYAQDASQTEILAKTLSEVGGVPLGTTVTDLVTKSATTSITSNLPSSKDVTANAIPLDATITNKGYVVRDVEFDPRFEANVKRVLGQISLKTISQVSPNPSGITIPTSNVPKNSIKVFGSTITLPDIASRMATETYANLSPNLRMSTPSTDTSNERVWGGVAVPDSADAFRDTVAVTGNNKLCSGARIGTDWVITAAHCYCDGITDDVIFGTTVLSSDRIKVLKDQSKVYRPCDEIAANPGVGDIALLKLERTPTQPAKPIASLAMVKDSAAVRAVGFGRTATAVGFKYQVNIVIASYQCDGSAVQGLPDSQVYRCKPSHELVAAGLNRDTCAGDSGGGVYLWGPDSQVYIAALTSRGVHPQGQCGLGGIYTLLSASPIREWLEEAGIKVPQ